MMAEEKRNISLVLSIFKGENFVTKIPGGLRCQITGTLDKQTLDSGIVTLVPSNSEPAFNSQLAWQLSRAELRNIRTKKEAVKVRCILLPNEANSKAVEMGYAVLNVKDAFRMSSVEEIDPSKAKSYLLLGTKEHWQTYHPKLCMQLHIEEPDLPGISEASSKNIIKKEIEKSQKSLPNPPSNAPSFGDMVRPTTKIEVMQDKMADEKFKWKINDDEGYFQLNLPSESDDLYIVNITIISASFLHSLWNGRTVKNSSVDDYVWQIKYKAYGCEIKSDPFTLSHDDDKSRRTFIGDKATARIRANAVSFFKYLENSSLEFQAIRFQISPENELIDEEVMGFSFADLKALAQSDISELKATLEIVSEWGYPKSINPTEKPEVRVIFELDAMPGFFANRTILLNDTSLNSLNESISMLKVEPHDHQQLALEGSKNGHGLMKLEDVLVDDLIEEVKELELRAENQSQYMDSDKSGDENDGGRIGIDSSQPTGIFPDSQQPSHMFSETKFTPENRAADKPPEKKKQKLSSEIESSSFSNSSSSSNNIGNVQQGDQNSSRENNASELHFNDQSSNSEASSNKENTKEIILPKTGTYQISIGLKKFWLKSKISLKDDMILTYTHPPFGMVDKGFVCTARPSTDVKHSKPHFQCMTIDDGITSLKASFCKFSEKTLNEPLTVEFRKYIKDCMEPTFAFSMIPVGSIFLQEEPTDGEGIRLLRGSVEILKSGTNLKIGSLFYFVGMKYISPKSSRKTPHQNPARPLREKEKYNDERNVEFQPDVPRTKQKIDQKLVFQTVEDLNEWKVEQEQIFLENRQKKERAYLRILAEEASKRDKEREKVTADKISECKKKEKELTQKLKQVTEREEKLKQLELELTSSAHKATLSQTNILENAKLRIHRMQEEHQIEVSSLQRRNAEYEAELEKLKGKLSILEKKLEHKEEQMSSEKHERLDYRLSEKLKLLAQENKSLKKQILEVERSRDQYKKQSQTLCHKLARLQEERDRKLKDENESLRLQILASKEHKELKKERKVVSELSETIKTMQNSSKAKEQSVATLNLSQQRDVSVKAKNISLSSVPNESEIARLTEVRNGLLSSGAYTQYDMVIKEMERRIVNLAQGDHK